MERKVKMGLSAMMIVAITFTILGATFLPIGIIAGLGLMQVDGSFSVFVIMFAGLGSIFLALGILFFVIEIKKRNRCNLNKQPAAHQKPRRGRRVPGGVRGAD